MELNKSVSNPMLVGCIELMKDEDSPEHRNMFVGELVKASLITPVIVEPEPVQDANGKLMIAPGSKIQFPMLIAPDGKKFFMGFTDTKEYRKWAEKNKDLPTLVLNFNDYAGMLFSRDGEGNIGPALGYIINPFGAHVVVPREMVAGVMAARMGVPPMRKASAPAQTQEEPAGEK